MKIQENFDSKQGICYGCDGYVYGLWMDWEDEETEYFTYQDLLEIVTTHLENAGRDFDPEKVVESLFNALDWQHPATVLDEMETENDYGAPYYKPEN